MAVLRPVPDYTDTAHVTNGSSSVHNIFQSPLRKRFLVSRTYSLPTTEENVSSRKVSAEGR
jgi:hypothetical protein